MTVTRTLALMISTSVALPACGGDKKTEENEPVAPKTKPADTCACTSGGTCTYTPQKTGANAVAETCAVTNAMRIDSSGFSLEGRMQCQFGAAVVDAATGETD